MTREGDGAETHVDGYNESSLTDKFSMREYYISVSSFGMKLGLLSLSGNEFAEESGHVELSRLVLIEAQRVEAYEPKHWQQTSI